MIQEFWSKIRQDLDDRIKKNSSLQWSNAVRLPSKVLVQSCIPSRGPGKACVPRERSPKLARLDKGNTCDDCEFENRERKIKRISKRIQKQSSRLSRHEPAKLPLMSSNPKRRMQRAQAPAYSKLKKSILKQKETVRQREITKKNKVIRDSKAIDVVKPC